MDFRIFSLGSNDALAKRIAKKSGQELGAVKCKTFSDGEHHVQFQENLRGKDVFLVQSTGTPDAWLQLFLAVDAARGASAREITAVVPYMGYARQDRKSKPREPISARVFASTLEALGVTRLLTMDLHNDAIGGFFRLTNVDYLYARPVFVEHFKKVFGSALEAGELVVVSPDAGGVVRAQSYAKRLMPEGAELAIIHKERDIPNQIARMKLIGSVEGKIALIVDDMADTCGTLARAAALLDEHGAREVYATTTHAVLSGSALENVQASPIKKLFVTDTVAHDKLPAQFETVSVADIFGDAICRIESGESLSALFEAE
jgi:ribose-phosphate pyrophosphokinase